MRNPNGYGTVAKLSGQRRRPYIVKKTIGWNDKGHPIYDIIGYAETREAGNIMLAEYNRDPWDVDRAKITLQQLFDLWKEKKAPKLGESNRSSLCSAFKHCSAYVNKPYKQLRSYQMQETIDGCGKGYSTQAAIKNLWGHLDRFALEMDIINRCFSELLTSDPIPPTSRLPFTNDEIKTVWEHQSDPWVDTVLILLYSGWRISEFLNLKPEDIDLKEGTMKGGTKTKAGKNRIVPIHPKIRPLIEQRLAEGRHRQNRYIQNRPKKVLPQYTVMILTGRGLLRMSFSLKQNRPDQKQKLAHMKKKHRKMKIRKTTEPCWIYRPCVLIFRKLQKQRK